MLYNLHSKSKHVDGNKMASSELGNNTKMYVCVQDTEADGNDQKKRGILKLRLNYDSRNSLSLYLYLYLCTSSGVSQQVINVKIFTRLADWIYRYLKMGKTQKKKIQFQN